MPSRKSLYAVFVIGMLTVSCSPKFDPHNYEMVKTTVSSRQAASDDGDTSYHITRVKTLWADLGRDKLGRTNERAAYYLRHIYEVDADLADGDLVQIIMTNHFDLPDSSDDQMQRFAHYKHAQIGERTYSLVSFEKTGRCQTDCTLSEYLGISFTLKDARNWAEKAQPINVSVVPRSYDRKTVSLALPAAYIQAFIDGVEEAH